MTDLGARRARYQRDSRSIQLGGLASNLSRIAWFAEHDGRNEMSPVLRESKYFTEWAAAACSIEQQAMLADLQLELCLWERKFRNGMSRVNIAQEANQWSERLLQEAGLLNQ